MENEGCGFRGDFGRFGGDCVGCMGMVVVEVNGE